MTSTSASVRITLDKKIIEEAFLSITPWSVKNAILKTRIKLQDEVGSLDVINVFIVVHTGLTKSLCNVNYAEYQGLRYGIGYYSKGRSIWNSFHSPQSEECAANCYSECDIR